MNLAWIVVAMSVTVGGVSRDYELHLPNGRAPSEPAPLVLVFHGGGGNAANATRMSGMNERADAEGFIVAYPNGSGPRPDVLLTWNAWKCCGPALDKNVDDVGFVRALVDDLARRYPVDRKRVYATGFSNGAMLTYRLGCELGDVFAAIAPVAGALDNYDCGTGPKVSVIAFHGTADKHILFGGGVPVTAFDRHKRADTGVQFAIDTWRKRDACAAEPKRERKASVIHTAYGCADGTAVELYAIEGQGHAWPGGQKGRRFGNVDDPSTEISASDVIWEFFKAHPKK
jgi:polyhydroxybutyrate depolymerase